MSSRIGLRRGPHRDRGSRARPGGTAGRLTSAREERADWSIAAKRVESRRAERSGSRATWSGSIPVSSGTLEISESLGHEPGIGLGPLQQGEDAGSIVKALRCGDPQESDHIRLVRGSSSRARIRARSWRASASSGSASRAFSSSESAERRSLVLARRAFPRWALALRGSRSRARWKSAAAARVVAEPGEAPGDEQVRIGGAGADRLAERLLRILATTQPRQGLGVCRQHGRGFLAELDAVPEVGQGLLGMTQLQVRQAAIDPGIDELAIDLEGTIVGRQRLDEAAGSRRARPRFRCGQAKSGASTVQIVKSATASACLP